MLQSERVALRAVERAIRCYQSLGFVEEGRQLYVSGEYVDVVIMGLLREEWQARRGH